MRNYRNLFIAVPFFLIVFTGCAGTQKVMTNNSHVIITTSLDNVSQSDIKRVEKEAEKALDSVYPILGIEKRKTIRISIVDKGICRVYEGVISLPINHVRNKKAAIIHEVTHIIARHGDNRFFSEGLAVYFQERFGEDHGFPNFSGVPLDNLVKGYNGQLIPLSNLARNNDIFRQVGTRKRKIAYIEAGSFINFLVEIHGEQKLQELHSNWALNYKKVYGKNIKELEIEWKSYVFK